MYRYFRTEESKESLLTIPVGNVTATTELTYEYGVRSKKSRQKQKSEQSKGICSHYHVLDELCVLVRAGYFLADVAHSLCMNNNYYCSAITFMMMSMHSDKSIHQ